MNMHCSALTTAGTPCSRTYAYMIDVMQRTTTIYAKGCLPQRYDGADFLSNEVPLCKQHTTLIMQGKALSTTHPMSTITNQENTMPYDPEKDTDPTHMEDHYNGDTWSPGDQLPGGCFVSEYSNEVDWEPVICKVCGHALSDDEDVCPKAKIKCGKGHYHHTTQEVRSCYGVEEPKSKSTWIADKLEHAYFGSGRKIRNPYAR